MLKTLICKRPLALEDNYCLEAMVGEWRKL
jgi:hypothetical protein